MRSLLFAGALLAALLAAPARSAERAVPSATEEITVTAARLPRIVRTFIEAATMMPSPIGQVSRWKVSVCPEATGMKAPFTDFVNKRIREIGAPVNTDTSCGANLNIIFTEHPQEMLDAIRTKSPALLGYHCAPQAKELATVAHPIQAWYATGSHDRNGQLMVDNPYGLNTASVEGSRLRTGLRSEFVAVTVVVDLAAVENLEIGAVTDHIAMLAFSQAKAFERCREVASITNMLLDCGAGLEAATLSPATTAPT